MEPVEYARSPLILHCTLTFVPSVIVVSSGINATSNAAPAQASDEDDEEDDDGDDDDEDEHEERQGRYECKTGGKGEKRTIHVSRHRQDQSRMDTDFSEHEEVDVEMTPISFNSQRTKSSKF